MILHIPAKTSINSLFTPLNKNRAEGLQVKFTILINNWSIYD